MPAPLSLSFTLQGGDIKFKFLPKKMNDFSRPLSLQVLFAPRGQKEGGGREEEMKNGPQRGSDIFSRERLAADLILVLGILLCLLHHRERASLRARRDGHSARSSITRRPIQRWGRAARTLISSHRIVSQNMRWPRKNLIISLVCAKCTWCRRLHLLLLHPSHLTSHSNFFSALGHSHFYALANNGLLLACLNVHPRRKERRKKTWMELLREYRQCFQGTRVIQCAPR